MPSLPFVLLGLRMIPNESGYSLFTAVTGIQLLFPCIPVDQQSVKSQHNFIQTLARNVQHIDFLSVNR